MILALWSIKLYFDFFENLIISPLAIFIIIVSTMLTSFSNTMHYALSLKRNTIIHIWSDFSSVLLQFIASYVAVITIGKNDNILLIGWFFYNLTRFIILFIHFLSFYFDKNWELKKSFFEICQNYILFFKNAINQSYTFIIRTIITKSFGLETLGIYWHSQQYFNLFKLFQRSIIDTIWPDYLNQVKQNDSTDYNKIIVSFLNLSLMIGSLFFFYFGEEFVGFVSNQKFNYAAKFVPMWLLVISLLMTGNENTAEMQLKQKSGMLTFIEFIAIVLSIIICFALINIIGLFGAIISFMSYHFLLRLGNKIFLKKYSTVNVATIQFLYLSFFILFNYLVIYLSDSFGFVLFSLNLIIIIIFIYININSKEISNIKNLILKKLK